MFIQKQRLGLVSVTVNYSYSQKQRGYLLHEILLQNTETRLSPAVRGLRPLERKTSKVTLTPRHIRETKVLETGGKALQFT